MHIPKIIHILTRTPLHIGAGSSVGLVDMPLQRERYTQIPIIPGSAIKGVFRDLWNDDTAKQEELFGSSPETTEHEKLRAGKLIFSEARVLCFPVRSAKNSFAWVTSPFALMRYAGDFGALMPITIELNDDECIASDELTIESNKVVLEEYCFKKTQNIPPEVKELLGHIFKTDPVWSTYPKRLAIISDGFFSYFCANACEIQQRIRIDDQTGTVAEHSLFNQENVPSACLFYGIIVSRDSDDAYKQLNDKLKDNQNTARFGGDETIGLGYCSVEILDKEVKNNVQP